MRCQIAVALFVMGIGVSAAAELRLAPLSALGLDSRVTTERNLAALSESYQWLHSTADDFGAWRGRIGSYEATVFGKPASLPDQILLEHQFPVPNELIEQTFGLDADTAQAGACDPVKCEVVFYGCNSGRCHIEVRTDFPSPQTSKQPAFAGYISVLWSADGFDPTPTPWFLTRFETFR